MRQDFYHLLNEECDIQKLNDSQPGPPDSKICALSQTHTRGPEDNNRCWACLGHVAPKVEMRLEGKEVFSAEIIQQSWLRNPVCCTEPGCWWATRCPEPRSRPKVREQQLWVSRGSWSADRRSEERMETPGQKAHVAPERQKKRVKPRDALNSK